MFEDWTKLSKGELVALIYRVILGEGRVEEENFIFERVQKDPKTAKIYQRINEDSELIEQALETYRKKNPDDFNSKGMRESERLETLKRLAEHLNPSTKESLSIGGGCSRETQRPGQREVSQSTGKSEGSRSASGERESDEDSVNLFRPRRRKQDDAE